MDIKLLHLNTCVTPRILCCDCQRINGTLNNSGRELDNIYHDEGFKQSQNRHTNRISNRQIYNAFM